MANLGNTMEGKTVENRCPKSKLKTSLEITNIKINQLSHEWWVKMMSTLIQQMNTAMKFIPISHREHKALLYKEYSLKTQLHLHIHTYMRQFLIFFRYLLYK